MTDHSRIEIIKEVSEIVLETINPKLEYSIAERINGIKNSIIALGVSLAVTVVGLAFWFGSFSGSINGKMDIFLEANKGVLEKVGDVSNNLNSTDDQQLIIRMQLNKIDPTFPAPTVTRGNNTKKN